MAFLSPPTIAEGFRCERMGRSPNACFNLSNKSITSMWKGMNYDTLEPDQRH
jgi:hypothetical protein